MFAGEKTTGPTCLESSVGGETVPSLLAQGIAPSVAPRYLLAGGGGATRCPARGSPLSLLLYAGARERHDAARRERHAAHGVAPDEDAVRLHWEDAERFFPDEGDRSRVQLLPQRWVYGAARRSCTRKRSPSSGKKR